MADDRRSPRRVANTVHTFQLEPKNDAVVLNFSDAGLGFRARNPLMTQRGPIRFSFSENGQQFEAIGELAWTDSTRKTGGLCLDSLPQVDRERIQKWIDQGVTPRKAPAVSERATPAPREFPVPAADQTEANVQANVQANAQTHCQANPQSNVQSNAQSEVRPGPSFALPNTAAPQSAQPGFALFEDYPRPNRYTWDPEMPAAYPPRTKFISGFLTGAFLAALIAAILFFFFGDQANSLRSQLEERLGVASSPQTSPAAVPPAAIPHAPVPPAAVPSPTVPAELPEPSNAQAPSVSGPPPIFGTDSKLSSGPPNIATGPPLPDNHIARAPEGSAPKTGDPGDEDLALAQRYLGSNSRPGDAAAATRFLWAAVQQGNVKAEIILAGLFARGDGVTKSCEQARVLLRAAAEKGSSEASTQLAQIIRSGCR
jgi:hypothetical protein